MTDGYRKLMSNLCEKCGIQCSWGAKGRDEHGLCTQCQIGDQSPSLWLLGKIKKKLEEPLEKSQVHLRHRTAQISLIYNAKTGQCVGNDLPHGARRRDFVCIAVSVECENKPGLPNIRLMFRRWLDGGASAMESLGPYRILNIDNFMAEASQLYVVAISGLIDFVKEDMYFCSGCSTEKKNPPVGRYFAGTYCHPCWEAYKKKNSRTCLKCRRPLWECYC